MLNFFSKLLDANEKELKSLRPLVEKINSLEEKTKKLKKEDFAAKTASFKKRLARGESFEDILPEAFALVREAGRRTVGMRLFDVQLMAGICLFRGKIAEQKTGEGKTLSAVPALYLRALAGRGAHLVTVNDYLARRDAGWNGPIFNLLGLSVGAIYSGEGDQPALLYDPSYEDKSHKDERLFNLRPVPRKEAYQADVTYGTNNEFGFDYLRDNMVSRIEDMVQPRLHAPGGQGGHFFAIVDEVDSILIDEARTPLIISAPETEATEKYYQFAELVERLSPDTDYTIDEKLRIASLTDHGLRKVEKMLGVENLYEKDFETIHHIENALRAKTLFKKDKDYVVKNNQVIIVDEFTGRLMFGRRWSDGLHQAIEAKEQVPIQQESRTLATITFQNYFRMYEVLAGMSATSATEAEEFDKIYGLDVVVIPTNKPMIRKDYPDVVYKTSQAKYAAIASEIQNYYKRGQPVLVGTTSIEKNEIISSILSRKKIPHQVLNAKQHEKEAQIIAQAGKKKSVTVATNMAGRGVDIVLGGYLPSDASLEEKKKWQREHEEVVKLGGLHVVGTERHEARRIDNQLRGRSGRQGDPGSSRFFVALDDDLMRIFGGEQVSSLMTRFKLPEDQPLEHPMVTRAIRQAQIKVEGFNFDIRKHLVEYDDVANKQREIIYGLRRKILEGKNMREEILAKIKKDIENSVLVYSGEGFIEPEYEAIIANFCQIVPFDSGSQDKLKTQIKKLKKPEEITNFLFKLVNDLYEKREKEVGDKLAREIEKFAFLSAIDNLWTRHLEALEGLREGIGLRGYGQRDPLTSYKNEAFSMFETLLSRIDKEVVRRVFRIQVTPQQPLSTMPENIRTNIDRQDGIGLAAQPVGQKAISQPQSQQQIVRKKKKVGRNDPCPCGSGKKYKKCCYPKYT